MNAQMGVHYLHFDDNSYCSLWGLTAKPEVLNTFETVDDFKHKNPKSCLTKGAFH